MTLDPETKARIEAEEAYRAGLRRPPPLALAWAGCALLAIGTFLPILHFPALGSMNLLGGGTSDGAILIGLAVLGVVLAYAKRLWLLLPAALAGGLIVYRFLTFQSAANASGVELGWAWLPLAAGVGLMAWAALRAPPP